MGTTAQKLQAVLNSKNAIKSKFKLPDDLPFSQYAENIVAETNMDVSSTTAAASDVLEGKLFYNARGELTAGTYIPPAVGGSAEYYKCEEVADNTWNGYKAILDAEGYYTFEETLTDGLTYGNGFTPEAGNVYDSNAMVKVNLYQKTLLPETLYSTDFSNLSDFTLQGTVTSNVDASGRKFANFNRGRLKFDMPELPQSNSPWTMAFGVRNLQNYGDGVCFFNGGKTPGSDGVVFTGVENSAGGVFVTGWGNRITSPTSILNNSDWTRVLITYDGSTAAIYLNGVKDVEGAVSVNITGTTCAFGGSFWGSYNLMADLADFKVWGIAFNQEQVNIDYAEFSGNSSGEDVPDEDKGTVFAVQQNARTSSTIVQCKITSSGSGTIDWGDGNTTEISSGTDAVYSHDYGDSFSSEHIVTIKGSAITKIDCGYNANYPYCYAITRLIRLGDTLTNMDWMFNNCLALTRIEDTVQIPAGVTGMGYAFNSSSYINYAPSTLRLPANCTNFSYAFSMVSASTDISHWFDDFANAPSGASINMEQAFRGSKFTGTLPADLLWNNSNINWTNTWQCFRDASSLANYSDIPSSWKDA